MSKERVKKGMLRKAGQALTIGAKKTAKAVGKADAAYANAVDKATNKSNNPGAYITRGLPLNEVYKNQLQADSPVERLVGEAATAGVLAAKSASRYALPAAGVTLAGKGLYDLTTKFGSKADEPEETTLPMQ